MSTIPGLVFFVAIVLVGIASTVGATIWTWQMLRRRNLGVLPAVVVSGVAAVVAFGGLWILFDLVWMVASAARFLIRWTDTFRSPSPDETVGP